MAVTVAGCIAPPAAIYDCIKRPFNGGKDNGLEVLEATGRLTKDWRLQEVNGLTRYFLVSFLLSDTKSPFKIFSRNKLKGRGTDRFQ